MAEQINFALLLTALLESNELTHEEAKEALEEVLKKAFEIEKDHLSRYEEEDPEPADVKVTVDLNEGKVEVVKHLQVTEDYSQALRFKQIELTDERIEGLGLNPGDIFEEVINLNEITDTMRNRIGQLFKQKLSELDKKKTYEKFSLHRNELLSPTVHKILKHGNLILDYNGDSIFMPSREISSLDKDKIVIGRPLTIFVLDVEEMSKDAQIIASRANPQFVSKLIEREIDDVHDGVVTIEAISREAGFKTKVAVSTTDPNIDPVGSIIGVKGQKIKPIVEEIGGERLDVIKYHPDIKQFIAEALLPAEITGIKVEEDEEGWRTATVIVEEDQFLPALGKGGINIKLAAILTKSKLDVKTIAEAKAEGIEWEAISKSKFVSQGQTAIIDLDEFGHISDDVHHDEVTDFSDHDYGMDDHFEEFHPTTNEEEDFYHPDEDEYEEEF